jgi:predicted adenine nucleotide alpha hydrolase (AANH) superfamily ATPase
MAGMETRLEDAIMRRMDQMEQRMEEVARQGRKERTDMVVSTLTISITKKKQIVSQKMKRVLLGLVSRGRGWRGTW